MTLYDLGTLPPVAPLGPTYAMDQPIQIEHGVWALPQYRKEAPPTELPVVQTYRWGQWGEPLGTASYSRTGVPGGAPTLTPGYLHRNGVIGAGSPPLPVTPWQPSELPGARLSRESKLRYVPPPNPPVQGDYIHWRVSGGATEQYWFWVLEGEPLPYEGWPHREAPVDSDFYRAFGPYPWYGWEYGNAQPNFAGSRVATPIAIDTWPEHSATDVWWVPYPQNDFEPKDARFVTSTGAVQDGRPDRWARVGVVMNQRLADGMLVYDGFSLYLDGRLIPAPGLNAIRERAVKRLYWRWLHDPWNLLYTRDEAWFFSNGAMAPEDPDDALITDSLPFRLGISQGYFVAIGSDVGYGAHFAVLNRATGGVVTRFRSGEHVTAGPLIRGSTLLYYATDPAAPGFTRRVVVDLTTMAFTVERTESYLIQHAAVAPSYLTDIPRLTTQGVLLMDDDSLDLGLELEVPSADTGGGTTGGGGGSFTGSFSQSDLQRTTLSVSANTILATTIPPLQAPILNRSAYYTPVTEGGMVRAILWTGDTELDFGVHRSRGHFS